MRVMEQLAIHEDRIVVVLGQLVSAARPEGDGGGVSGIGADWGEVSLGWWSVWVWCLYWPTVHHWDELCAGSELCFWSWV